MKEKWIPFSQLGIVFVLFVLQSFISLIINIKRSTWNRHFEKIKHFLYFTSNLRFWIWEKYLCRRDNEYELTKRGKKWRKYFWWVLNLYPSKILLGSTGSGWKWAKLNGHLRWLIWMKMNGRWRYKKNLGDLWWAVKVQGYLGKSPVLVKNSVYVQKTVHYSLLGPAFWFHDRPISVSCTSILR